MRVLHSPGVRAGIRGYMGRAGQHGGIATDHAVRVSSYGSG